MDCGSTYESRCHTVDYLLECGVTAIICAYSPDAITIIGLLHDRGIELGTQMSLISFDDIAPFRLMTPKISVISQQAEQMGRQGVDLLLEAMQSGVHQGGSTIHVPTVYLSRGSVARVVVSAQ